MNAAAVKTVRTPRLEIRYEERPGSEPAVVLVHGFPDDVRTWDAVVASEELRGVRTIAPYLRGFGTTRFASEAIPRSGEITALARDLADFIEALELSDVVLVGHDWGARAAYGAAVFVPQRIRKLIALSVGYGSSQAAQTISHEQMRAYWYQWYFATARGEAALRDDRRAFCAALWRMWSPGWAFGPVEFERTAASFDNPDFAAVVLHSYRSRWGFAPGDAAYADDRRVLDALPPLGMPVVVLHGADDGATLLESTEGRERYFRGGYERSVLPDAGHFVQRERPGAVAAEIGRALGRHAPR